MLVFVLGKPYRVDYVEAEDIGGDVGQCRPAHQWIKLDRALPSEQRAETLLHEVIEGINWELGLSMTEAQIRGLSAALFGTLRGNPELAKEVVP